MKVVKFLFVILILITIFYIYKKQEKGPIIQQTLFSSEEVKIISKHLAHLTKENLQEFYPYYDFNEFIKALSEKDDTVESSYATLMEFKDRIFNEEARKNLEIASQFLSHLPFKENIIEVKKGKIYYEILQPGTGAVITDDSTPLIHFTEMDLSNAVLQDTTGKIPLKETIVGFRQGVAGMQVGEKRKIYVHPDLAYGKFGQYASQQLIIFIVEIIDA